MTVRSSDIAGAYGTSKKPVERLRGMDQEALSLLLVFNLVNCKRWRSCLAIQF